MECFPNFTVFIIVYNLIQSTTSCLCLVLVLLAQPQQENVLSILGFKNLVPYSEYSLN